MSSENSKENGSQTESSQNPTCAICSCSTSSKMERHTGIHIDSMGAEAAFQKQSRDVRRTRAPLQCDRCTYSTRYRGNLERHMGIHVDASGEEVAFVKRLLDAEMERRIECGECAFSTDSVAIFERHLVAHAGR